MMPQGTWHRHKVISKCLQTRQYSTYRALEERSDEAGEPLMVVDHLYLKLAV